jgi:hypothetical protein
MKQATFLCALMLATTADAALIRVPADRPTVQAALAVMQPGDTVDVGPGVYEGPINLGRIRCTATLPCTLRGAGMLSTYIRGMRAESTWTSLGGGVYRHAMTASVDPITTLGDGFPMRDAYDPANVYQRDGFVNPITGTLEHLPLGYAGDGVAAPGDGRWSYDPATHTVTANPYGNAPPTDLLIPFLSRLFDLRTSQGYWTITDIALEGSRAFGSNHELSAGPLPGMVLRNVGGGYVPRWWAKWQPPLGVIVDNVRLRWIARGMSAIVPVGQRSGYGLRFFNANGALLSGIDCRHLGAGASWCGASAVSGFAGCMPPWNTDAFTTVGGAGHCVDLKQTDGATFTMGFIDDGPVQGGVKLDVSRNVTVENTYFSRNVRALVLNEQTPQVTPYGTFLSTSAIRVLRNTFDGNGVDFTVRSTASLAATLQGNRRTDGSPLRTDPSPLPASVVVLPDTGATTTLPTATTSTTTVSTSTNTTTTTASTTTSTTATSSTAPTTVTTTSTTSTTCLCPCPCGGT